MICKRKVNPDIRQGQFTLDCPCVIMKKIELKQLRSKYVMAKQRRKFFEGKRNIWIKTWFHSGFRRMCRRAWKRMEISIYDRKIWWGSFYPDLSGISGAAGSADPCKRVCCRTKQPLKYSESISQTGAGRIKFS